MILAAGLGSRLKPITDKIPKALVEVNGKTLLQYNIERIVSSGINNIAINVHHFSEKVINYLHENRNFGANIFISDETDKLLDTGGGIKKVSEWLQDDQPILIQNVDIYTNINYKKMFEFHKKKNALATVAVRNRESSRYLMFNDENELCGWQNTNTKQKIVTREVQHTNNLAFSCTHILDAKLLSFLPDKEVFSIINTYLELSKQHTIAGFLHNNDYWFDIGTPEKLANLELFLQKNRY